jgi:hypothetical protein
MGDSVIIYCTPLYSIGSKLSIDKHFYLQVVDVEGNIFLGASFPVAFRVGSGSGRLHLAVLSYDHFMDVFKVIRITDMRKSVPLSACGISKAPSPSIHAKSFFRKDLLPILR